MKNATMLLVALAVLLLVPVSHAAHLGDLQQSIFEATDRGVPTTRVTDLFTALNASTTHNSTIGSRGQRIQDILSLSTRLQDEIGVAKKDLRDLSADNPQLDTVNETLQSAITAYEEERFEDSEDELEQYYEELSEARGAETRVRAILESGQNTASYFVSEYKYHLLFGGLVAILIGWGIQYETKRYLLRRKIQKLNHRKTVLQDLIADAQDKYFDEKSMDEATYMSRTKKYSELIREVNRELPLVKEKLRGKE